MPISKLDLHPALSSCAAASPAWLTVKRLYPQAVELSDPAREAFLAAAAVGEAVRVEVRSLLAYSPDANGPECAGFFEHTGRHRPTGCHAAGPAKPLPASRIWRSISA